jgi:hypothetical protein
MPAFDGRCWATDGRYWMRLSNGVLVPYTDWASLQKQACRGFNCTRETLWAEIAWRIGGDVPDGWEPSPGIVANEGLTCGLWTHARRPYPYPCEARARRHTARTFLPWEKWPADLPDVPGGDFQ